MPLADGDPITRAMLATAADLLKHTNPGMAQVLVDGASRRVRITCRGVDRAWLQALAAAGASGGHARPATEQLDAQRREAIERAVLGALQSCIHDHGPITADMLTSAAKRVVGNLANLASA